MQRKEVNPEKRERKQIPFPMQEKFTALLSMERKRRTLLPRQSMSIMRKMNWWHLLTRRGEKRVILMMKTAISQKP